MPFEKLCPSCGKKPPFESIQSERKKEHSWYKFVSTDLVCQKCNAKLEVEISSKFYPISAVLISMLFAGLYFVHVLSKNSYIPEQYESRISIFYLVFFYLVAAYTLKYLKSYKLKE